MCLILVLPLAAVVTFDVVFFQVLDVSSSVARLTLRLVLGILILGSFVRLLRTIRRERERRRAGELAYPDILPGGGRHRLAGAGIGALARSGSALAGGFLAVGSVVFLGTIVIAFLQTFRHEPGLEHDARLRTQRRQKGQALQPTTPPSG